MVIWRQNGGAGQSEKLGVIRIAFEFFSGPEKVVLKLDAT